MVWWSGLWWSVVVVVVVVVVGTGTTMTRPTQRWVEGGTWKEDMMHGNCFIFRTCSVLYR